MWPSFACVNNLVLLDLVLHVWATRPYLTQFCMCDLICMIYLVDHDLLYCMTYLCISDLLVVTVGDVEMSPCVVGCTVHITNRCNYFISWSKDCSRETTENRSKLVLTTNGRVYKFIQCLRKVVVSSHVVSRSVVVVISSFVHKSQVWSQKKTTQKAGWLLQSTGNGAQLVDRCQGLA